MSWLQPYFLAKTKQYILDGYCLKDIIDEYNKEGSNEFNDEIIVSYYHLNNGPDLRDYQKETLKRLLNLLKHIITINYYGVVV